MADTIRKLKELMSRHGMDVNRLKEGLLNKRYYLCEEDSAQDYDRLKSPIISKHKKRLPKIWITLTACLMVLTVVSFFGEVTLPGRVSVLNGAKVLNLNVELGYKFQSEGRGWHWLNRRKPLDEDNSEDRLTQHPYKDPLLEDTGENYLPFNAQLVDANYASTPVLYYDLNVIRLQDQFGLIDDGKTYEEMEAILQKVVDIFAVANIYIRVNTQDLSNVYALSRRKSLAFLQYVEGPDLAELVETQKTEKNPQLPVSDRQVAYIKWFKREMRKLFPVPSLALLLRGPKNGLTLSGFSDMKKQYQQGLVDWTIGYPVLLPPWDVVHTTSIFPVSYFHGMQDPADHGGGRIIAQTGSCAKEGYIVDTSVDRIVKNVTCRGFELGLMKRFQGDEKTIRPFEKLDLDTHATGKLWAHQLAKSLGLSKTRNQQCTMFSSWSDAWLMQNPRTVGQQGSGCPNPVTKEQYRGTKLSGKQIERIRQFVKSRDIRPSRTLPNAITIGDSTEQIGAGTNSPGLFHRFLSTDRKDMTGTGRKIFEKRSGCKLPQDIIVFTKLAVPINGQVHRLRWLPSMFPQKAPPASLKVMIVQPRESLSSAPLQVTFDIIREVVIPNAITSKAQHTHVEVDLPDPLLIEPGQFVALSRGDGKRMNIDTRIFGSDKVLYADAVGQFSHAVNNLFDALMIYLGVETSYPRVALANRQIDAFYYSKLDKAMEEQTEFVAERPNKDNLACTEPIFNFDLVLY